MGLAVVQVQQSALPSGAATETTLASVLSQLSSVLAALASIDGGTAAALGQTVMASCVPVAIASNQSAVPVSGTVTATGPLTDTQLRASAVPVSIAGTVTVAGTVSDAQLPSSLGQKVAAGSTSVVLASDQPSVPVSGPLTDAQLRASAVPVSGPQTDAQLRAFSATSGVTATGVVNSAVTCTLPAAGAGLFHYITSIRVSKLYASVGTASGAGVIITSTNLPGSPAWTTEQAAGALGTCAKVVDEVCGLPIRSAAANLNTTIVCPAQAQTIWRVNVTYYTGP